MPDIYFRRATDPYPKHNSEPNLSEAFGPTSHREHLRRAVGEAVAQTTINGVLNTPQTDPSPDLEAPTKSRVEELARCICKRLEDYAFKYTYVPISPADRSLEGLTKIINRRDDYANPKFDYIDALLNTKSGAFIRAFSTKAELTVESVGQPSHAFSEAFKKEFLEDFERAINYAPNGQDVEGETKAEVDLLTEGWTRAIIAWQRKIPEGVALKYEEIPDGPEGLRTLLNDYMAGTQHGNNLGLFTNSLTAARAMNEDGEPNPFSTKFERAALDQHRFYLSQFISNGGFNN